jgi:hypothetical protein
LTAPLPGAEDGTGTFTQLRVEYSKDIHPLLKRFCLECHATETKEGELDLERFASLDDVRADPAAWQKVIRMLATSEMPPEESPQPAAAEKKRLQTWVRRYLDVEARASAGDPGPVMLRRLNNAEYTYTVRDLTGVELDPTSEFPVDGAAGEGFTNTGEALAMSPSLVTKYLDAARNIAGHAVLLPDGIRFSKGDSPRDWTNEILAGIRAIYARHTGRLGDANSLNSWSVSDPTVLTDADGRVDLARYLESLIRHRQLLLVDVRRAAGIANKEKLNAKYFEHLATMLVSGEPSSVLFDRLRSRWRDAGPEEATAIAGEIRAWQDQLWSFNPVGHFGRANGWQVPASPIVESQNFRVELETKEGSDDVTLYLVASSAGDGDASDIVTWSNPQITRAGRPPILLRDVRATSIGFAKTRKKTLALTSKYLAAAFEVRSSDKPPDVAELAAAHGVNPQMLKTWLSYLGLSRSDEVKIKQYLTHPLRRLSGYDFVNGWGLVNVEALSLVGNASDKKVNIPGDLNPHKIVVHPRPERWVAAGWKSPLTGKVQLAARAHDAHPACGNGVSWSFELRRPGETRVLQSGTLDRSGSASIDPLPNFAIEQGDLVSLVIGSRDGNHACDLTEIDLTVTEEAGQKRVWSLSGDCADSIDAANPHADGFGNAAVWHFYTGGIGKKEVRPAVPPGSLLARWMDAKDASSAMQLAAELETLLTNPMPQEVSEPDAELYRRLRTLSGPLFSSIDPAELADSVSSEDLQTAQVGLDPALFGRHPDGSAAAANDLIVQAPLLLEVKLPADLIAGSEFAVSGMLHGATNDEGSVQFQVTTAKPTVGESLMPGVPIVVRKGSAAEVRVRKSLDGFRQLFPSAMCYPRIVPVDVVVTIVLFHREDDHLVRLMLDESEAKQLDKLWNELYFVSQDSLTSLTVFEQLMEFASQDDDPAKYEPLREPIDQRAAAFRKTLLAAEPAHLDTLLSLATRAYRRPLTSHETDNLRRLYNELRAQEIEHDEAIRLLLSRVLVAPAFLFRLEQPGPGEKSNPVSDWELASRLSYFLWSSMPDALLRKTAASGRLRHPQTLVAETERMLKDARVRRMAIEFACQWLHIREFDQLDEKSERHFPEFGALRTSMYEESIRFFEDLFRNDRSVLDILDADHTFLNEPLARHYGIPGVTGENWRLVEGMRRFSRGGILGQATTLAKQSGASRTSPILRGNWVSETLLGERLPRPPKDVPVLPETVPTGLTERQLIEQHTSNEACAKCHARIDPYGFALENFDAIGRFREKAQNGQPIDTRTKLRDGTPIEGLEGLRTYLLTTRREAFLRQFCRKLLGYALGRAVQLSDEPLLAEMADKLKEQDYRFSVAVETIVRSRQFREIRGKEMVRENSL